MIQTALLLAVSVVVIWRDRELFLTPPTPRATPGGIIQAWVANPDPTPSYPTGTGAGRPSLTHAASPGTHLLRPQSGTEHVVAIVVMARPVRPDGFMEQGSEVGVDARREKLIADRRRVRL